jgi:hypothetical protein
MFTIKVHSIMGAALVCLANGETWNSWDVNFKPQPVPQVLGSGSIARGKATAAFCSL